MPSTAYPRKEVIDNSNAAFLKSLYDNPNPTVETLQRIADALDVEIVDLFESNKKDGTIGFIKHEGQTYEINSIGDIEKLLAEIKRQ